MGKIKKAAALDGRNEIALLQLQLQWLMFSIFTDGAISGMIGNFLKEFALVVVFSYIDELIRFIYSYSTSRFAL